MLKPKSCSFDFELPDGQTVMVCYNVEAVEWAVITTEGKLLHTAFVLDREMNERVATEVLKEYLSTKN